MLKLELFPTLRRFVPFAPTSEDDSYPSPNLQAIEDYWNGLRGDRAMPARADIDPMDIVPHLPFVGLVDVLEGGHDFRFRLLGTALDYVFGDYYTGWRLSEIEREDLRRIFTAAFLPPTREGKPHRHSGLLTVSQNEHLEYELLVLPLSRDGVRPDMLFLCWSFTPLSAAGLPS